ncbi:MAG TPA: hypothetical protein VIL01_01390 [Thermomicrobiales bacterium]
MRDLDFDAPVGYAPDALPPTLSGLVRRWRAIADLYRLDKRHALAVGYESAADELERWITEQAERSAAA